MKLFLLLGAAIFFILALVSAWGSGFFTQESLLLALISLALILGLFYGNVFSFFRAMRKIFSTPPKNMEQCQFISPHGAQCEERAEYVLSFVAGTSGTYDPWVGSSAFFCKAHHPEIGEHAAETKKMTKARGLHIHYIASCRHPFHW